ncbi:MAG: hypothetical protein O3C40_08360 [Planctomycetota bacterium]|nr:hypothetical protein [Planctomycetota bacterium]
MVGKPDFLRSEQITGLEPLEASAAKLQEDGETAMFVAIDGDPAGVLYPFLRLAAQPDHCRCRDEPEFRRGHQQHPATAEREAVTAGSTPALQNFSSVS